MSINSLSIICNWGHPQWDANRRIHYFLPSEAFLWNANSFDR